MPVKKKPKRAGVTPPSQFRLGDDSLADLDEIVSANGLSTRTEGVRVALKREAEKTRKKRVAR
jgi:metal-responsive CopG/Arc/MetJ family transcriptional regulator